MLNILKGFKEWAMSIKAFQNFMNIKRTKEQKPSLHVRSYSFNIPSFVFLSLDITLLDQDRCFSFIKLFASKIFFFKLLQGASEGFECDDKPSILCLAPGYSTFDLPFRDQPNFIKIGRCLSQRNICKVHVFR